MFLFLLSIKTYTMTTPLKIIFVGDACSGKTRAVNRLLKRDLAGHLPYTATNGVRVYKCNNINNTMIDIWDCGGKDSYQDNYFIDADICVLFGYNTYNWAREVKKVTGDIIFYQYHNQLELQNFINSINNLGPSEHITTNEQTVINIFS